LGGKTFLLPCEVQHVGACKFTANTWSNKKKDKVYSYGKEWLSEKVERGLQA
jgi:hypothetical protein